MSTASGFAQSTIWDAHQALSKGEVSSQELTQACFDRIEKLNPKLNAYIHLTQELAMQQANAADERLAKKEKVTPLTGIPIAIKDIFLQKDVRTTCASRILENFVAPYTGTAVQRLLDQGVVTPGKVNMDEFAMGSSTENSCFGPTRNPWNNDYAPGGSSGGSAASVAAGLSLGSLGTDTGGSIKQPASLCGITGIKPTYGRVSRYGVIAFASSLDQVGPMGKDVRDCALILQAMAGHDPLDSTSVDVPVPNYLESLGQSIKGMTLGIPKEYWPENQDSGVDAEVLERCKEAVTVLEKLGATIKPVSLPHTHYAVSTYYIIAPAEASSNLARYDGVRYGQRNQDADNLVDMYCKSRGQGFGDEVKRRIMIGTYVLSAGYYDAYYVKAQKVRRLIRQGFDNAVKECQAIVTPTAPTAAFKLGSMSNDPLHMYMSDIFTVPANLAGLPGMSIPCGFTQDKLPVGLQLIGKPFDEGTLFQIGNAYERETTWPRLAS